MDITVEPRDVDGEESRLRAAGDALDGQPGPPRRPADGGQPARAAADRPPLPGSSTGCPARRTSRARTCSARAAALVGRLLGEEGRPALHTRDLKAPRTPLNGTITAHRRFAFGSIPLADVKTVKNHFGMTVNDVVMVLTAAALRRWLLDHDALPGTPLVAAVPVSIRTEDQAGSLGNQVSVMLAELPTHLGDTRERMAFMRESMADAKRAFDAVPASLLQDLSALVPTALSGLAARALFKLATVPGVIFNLFVSNVPGPQLPLYIAGPASRGSTRSPRSPTSPAG